MTSNAARAKANEQAVLVAVGEVGWLSTAQIACWVWPRSSHHVATNKASLVIQRLVAQGLLLRRTNSTGNGVFILTTKGAVQANGLDGPAYGAGYKLSQLDGYRQRLVVECLLRMRERGYQCTGPAGLRRALLTGALIDDSLRGADALVHLHDAQGLLPILVVRSLNKSVLEKALRLRDASGCLHLLGHPGLIRQVERSLQRCRSLS